MRMLHPTLFSSLCVVDELHGIVGGLDFVKGSWESEVLEMSVVLIQASQKRQKFPGAR